MAAVRVRYQTVEFGDVDLHLRTLRDRQQYSDDQGAAAALGISSAAWPMFGVVWAAGEVLARLMFDYEVEGLRILEVGCGIGLASLVLSHRAADITATDRHPEAEAFLRRNVELNELGEIPFTRTDWTDLESGLGHFDLIVGSDLLYEPDHVALLARFIDRHARNRCEVIIIDPGRSYHGRFSKAMVALGYTQDRLKMDSRCQPEPRFHGRILRYSRDS